MKHRLDDREKTIVALEKEISTKESALSLLSKSTGEAVAALDEDLSRRDAEIVRLTSVLKMAQDQLEQVNPSLEGGLSRSQSAQSTVKALEETLSKREAALNELNTKLRRSNAANESREADFVKLEGDLETARADLA